MMYYARSDTHYLLYIFDMMRNAIPDHYGEKDRKNALMLWVTLKSKEVALNRYEGISADPVTGRGPRGWYTALLRGSPYWSPQQLSVFKAIYTWRDQKARRDDESTYFIMSQQSLTDIVRVMPSDQKALWSLLSSSGCSLKPHLGELFQILQEARAAGVNGPALSEVLQPQSDSLAATARKVFKDKAANSSNATTSESTGQVPKVDDIRSRRSQLWGDMPLSTAWEATKAQQAAQQGEDVQVPLPWAHLTQGTVTTSDVPQQASGGTMSGVHTAETDYDMIPLEVPPPPAATVKEQPSSTSPEPDQDDNEIVIKKRGSRKRKARQRTEVATGGAGGEEGADAPFDYAAAQSVLRAPRTVEGQGEASRKRGKRGAERFRPHGQAGAGAEMPKPVRNLNAHKPGKTATFKN